MTYWGIKLTETFFTFLIVFILYNGLSFIYHGSFDDFHWVKAIIFPIIYTIAGMAGIGWYYERAYYLTTKTNNKNAILHKLYTLGYQPTTDKGPKFFFKRRKIFGFKTARLDDADHHFILHVMEKIPEYEVDD